MPHGYDLGSDRAENLSRPLVDRLERLMAATDMPSAHVELGESFAVWMLRRDDLARANRLADAAEQTGQLHHQLFVGGEPRAWARSDAQSGEVLSVHVGALS